MQASSGGLISFKHTQHTQHFDQEIDIWEDTVGHMWKSRTGCLGDVVVIWEVMAVGLLVVDLTVFGAWRW